MDDSTKIASVRFLAAHKRPYFATALFAMHLVAESRVETMAVDKYGRVYINPARIGTGSTASGEQWTAEQCAAVLVHELGHWLRKHHERAEHLIRQAPIEEVEETAYRVNVCFPPGTILGDGLPVEAPRTETVGAAGRVRVVTPMVRQYEGPLLTIRAAGAVLRCTPEHPLRVVRRRHKKGLTPIRLKEPEWAEAGTLTETDYVVIPSLPGTVTDTVFSLEPYMREGGNSLASRCTQREFVLNTETAWLLGLYTAEGSGRRSANLSLGPREQALVARAAGIAVAHGFAGTVTSHAGKAGAAGSITVYLSGPVLARALKEWCGDGALQKKVPWFIVHHTDLAIVRAYLEGLLAGDGSTSNQHVVLSTASAGLAVQVRLLLCRLGLGTWQTSRVQKAGRRILGKLIQSANKLFSVGWRWEPAQSPRTFKGRTFSSYARRWKPVDGGIAVPVRSVTSEPYSGPVYNMETSDHTYVAEGLLVHNCEDLEINDDFEAEKEAPEMKLHLPGDPPLPRKFGWPDGKLWEEYYQMMLANPPPKRGGGKAGSGQPGGGSPGQGLGKPQPSGRHPAPGKPAGDGSLPEKCDCGSGAHGVARPYELPAPGTGEPGKKAPGIGEAEGDLLRRQVAAEIQSAAQRAPGSVPAGWKRWAETLLEPAVVPWERELSALVKTAVTMARGAVDYSYTKVSRRGSFGGVLMPALVRPCPEASVVLDTSGSMGGDLLARALCEVQGILRVVGQRKVPVLCCDAAVHGGAQRVSSALDVELAGGGGTDMGVGIAAAQKLQSKVIIVLTDGATPWPKEPPRGCQLVVGVLDPAVDWEKSYPPPPYAKRVLAIRDPKGKSKAAA